MLQCGRTHARGPTVTRGGAFTSRCTWGAGRWSLALPPQAPDPRAATRVKKDTEKDTDKDEEKDRDIPWVRFQPIRENIRVVKGLPLTKEGEPSQEDYRKPRTARGTQGREARPEAAEPRTS